MVPQAWHRGKSSRRCHSSELSSAREAVRDYNGPRRRNEDVGSDALAGHDPIANVAARHALKDIDPKVSKIKGCSSRGVNFWRFINLSSPFTNRLFYLQMDWLIRKYAAYLQWTAYLQMD